MKSITKACKLIMAEYKVARAKVGEDDDCEYATGLYRAWVILQTPDPDTPQEARYHKLCAIPQKRRTAAETEELSELARKILKKSETESDRLRAIHTDHMFDEMRKDLGLPPSKWA